MLLHFACRSGTEEYTELHQLLEDISSYTQDLSASRAAQATIKAAQLKKAENKRKGLEIRQAAMEGITSELALLWSKFEIFMYYIYFPYFMLNREATRRNIYTQES